MKLVFEGDIIILALFAVFVVLALPRTFARFSSAWNQGHILWFTSDRTLARRRQRALPSLPATGFGSDKASDDSQSQDSHTLTDHYPSSLTPTSAPRYPSHIRAVSSLPFSSSIANFLARRFRPGFSIGQFLVTQGYSSVLQTILTLHSNPFSDPARAGLVAMAQVPFVFAFATKNNFLGWSLGLGYEKMNFIHRYSGQMLVIFSDIHALGYIYNWSIAGTFRQHLATPSNMWAFVAVAALNFIVIFSTAHTRAKAYRLFLFTHIVGFLVFLPALCMHKPLATPYVLVAVFIYSADHFVRVLKTRVTTARVRAMPDLSNGTTRIEIPSINGGWRAGQHVRLRILSSRMGWFGWAEAHPFTIASVPGAQSGEGMILLAKKSGTWTSRLYEMAKLGGYGEGGEGRVRVLVEGPYGGPGNTIFSSYSAAVFVVGGSGISYALSGVEDLLRLDAERKSRVKTIDVVWSVQDPASLVPLIPLFTALLQQSRAQEAAGGAILKISVHYTRATPGLVRLTKDYLIPGLSLTPGRPKVGKIVDAAISQTLALRSSESAGGSKQSSSDPEYWAKRGKAGGADGALDGKDANGLCGVVVGTCGPIAMADEVVNAVRGVEKARKGSVGGVEVAEEVFGW
ncbi:hypothetical protein FIBSPDRAFT_920412 [Athelia psychrophila]|uniref:ferric-chelate reductase (NADPH) n=1 Tax=Athelia psychrophila TaxID=1759441 RepID=A0A166H5U0_9AGAM|nr:hypothetical protein FIBSPDRAFT_920412 [Fibularhizoctonia sp. CBS 109695]